MRRLLNYIRKYSKLQVEEFFDLIVSYNEMYIIVIALTYVLAIVALLMVFKKSTYSNRIISLTLSFLWLWIGIVFGILVFGPFPTVLAGIEMTGSEVSPRSQCYAFLTFITT